MLAIAIAWVVASADIQVDSRSGTGPMSDASFGSVVSIIESAVPGMGSSMSSARDSGAVGFGVLKPGTTNQAGQTLSGLADADTCLVDVTLEVEDLASTLVHEWTHQLSFSGAFGPETETLSAACQEVLAYLQELLYVQARATWLFDEFGFAVLPCYHFKDARDGYDEFAADCHDPLPSWVPAAPSTPAHCK